MDDQPITPSEELRKAWDEWLQLLGRALTAGVPMAQLVSLTPGGDSSLERVRKMSGKLKRVVEELEVRDA